MKSINQFQGSWVNDYGRVEISKCKNMRCKIEIATSYGSYTCDLSEKLKVLSDNTAVFTVKNADVYNDHKDYPINLALTKNIISISVPEMSFKAARGYCGMRGFFQGEYTNSTTPRQYKTSFGCSHARTKIDFAVCQSSMLANADIVLNKLYFELKNKNYIPDILNQQKLWFSTLEKCSEKKNITQCLLIKYRDRILSFQQNLLNGNNELKIINRTVFYNNDYLLHLSRLSPISPYDFFQDPPLQLYLKSFLSQHAYENILRDAFTIMEFEDIDDKSLVMIKGGSPGLYTICEGALVLTKDRELWLAYINIDKDSKTQIFIFYSQNTNPNLMPEPLRLWVYKLLSEIDNREIIYQKITT